MGADAPASRLSASSMKLRRHRLLRAASGLALLTLAAGAAAAQGEIEARTDRKGLDYRGVALTKPEPDLCRQECAQDIACRAFTYVRPGLQSPQARCWLKFAVPPASADSCCASGVMRPTADVDALVPRPTAPRLEVVPVLFIPADNTALGEGLVARHADLFLAHLVTAQKFYRDQLQTDTFKIAGPQVVLYRSRHPSAYYTSRLRPPPGEADAPHLMLKELFDWIGEDRHASRRVYVIVFARTGAAPSGEPVFGGGRTFNGPPGSGGGSMELELTSLVADQPTFFQAALIHELGHAFGLVHVDCFGYDQRNHPSVMSYDARWDTRGLASSRGRFSPEDLHLLGQNKLAFPDFHYDAARHDPQRTRRRKPACRLGAMTSHIGQKAAGKRCVTYPCP